MAWSWRLLRAGSFRLDGGSMFGVVPKAVWSRLAEPDEHNRIPLQTNCLLLGRSGTSPRVLIETGFGGKWSEKDRGIFAMENRTIVDALAEVGAVPESIEIVIVTHLHFDHAGGLTRPDESGRPVPTFPNARIVAQRREWEDAVANKSTMTKTYLQSHLDPIRHQVECVTGDVEVDTDLRVAPMPGHTWGQQAVIFSDSIGEVCFPGDVVPTAAHVGDAFSMGYDMLPFDNMLSKRDLFSRAKDGGWRIVLDHEPGNPVVQVRDHEERPGQFAFERIVGSTAR